MAKKNYKKFLPKVGSTVAVAMAMTVALSTQAQAAELDDAEVLNGGLSMDEIEVNDKAMSAQIVPGSYNNEVEQSNDETIDENEETIENNDQTQQNNDDSQPEAKGHYTVFPCLHVVLIAAGHRCEVQ